ncbi:AraC family transcriptional regulator [Streptomyces tateyamensis]|uniref:AraC family transcriptional regulator n=1 Tax=Streptomyces tateyamensis TaxID=565073 RepID=A0A2V4NLD2_9ACTN|nr:AraC family transcriptional regulator [Streptomyces tateyamensis]PYC75803.1 AraC family transcriptional regulator [Streptomyces tateyamensis]
MVTELGPSRRIRAWHPGVTGISEVFHARMTDHVYPMHTHDTWTLLIIDDGMVRYDLSRHEHGALNQLVTLLPPHVPHNGNAVTSQGFRKRVLYLDSALLDDAMIGPAVDSPVLDDPLLRDRIHQLHGVLAHPGDTLEAESRLALIGERLRDHLTGRLELRRPPLHDAGLAHRLLEILDEHYVEGLTLQEASDLLFAHPTHLVRVFSKEFGIGPHQYLTGRRVDLGRRLLLQGMPAREVAVAAGFYDQSHFTRHFKRVLGASPGQFARSGATECQARPPT